MLDCASFCTLYVGALRDSRWPTLSVFFAGNVDFRAKNKTNPHVRATCPQKQIRPSPRAQKIGRICSNLALDRLPNPPAMRSYGIPRLRSQTLPICRSLLPTSLSFATLDPHRLCPIAVLRSLSYKNPSFLSLPKARGRSRTTPSGSALASTASLVGMVSGTHDGRDMRCVCSVGLRNKFLKCSKKTPNAHIDSCLHAIILQCSSWSGHGCGFESTVCRFGLISPVCVASRFICTLSIQSKGSNAKDQKRYRTDAMAPAISALFSVFIRVQLFTCSLKFHNRYLQSVHKVSVPETVWSETKPFQVLTLELASACARPQTCSTFLLLFRLFTIQVLNQMPGALPFLQPLA